MLKALELIGFKSFADRTRFEFPRGITVVVGPNGSGKSNVVDAIKWVLGEQSVKSLRGKEMVDVIFTGSSVRAALEHAPKRRSRSTIPTAASRSIPPKSTSLAASIAAAKANISSIASPAGSAIFAICSPAPASPPRPTASSSRARSTSCCNRRPRIAALIFEEASGISRFKAKKIEALRRLERVDQNLLRLHDIVDEVESRLKSVRLQAAKARRYKELRRPPAATPHPSRPRRLARPWRKALRRSNRKPRDLASQHRHRHRRRRMRPNNNPSPSWNRNQSSSDEANSQPSKPRLADNRQQIATGETTIEHRTHAGPRSRRTSRPSSQAIPRSQQPRRRPGRSLAVHRTPKCKPPKPGISEVSNQLGRPTARPHRPHRPARSNPQRKRTAPSHASRTASHQRLALQRNQHPRSPPFAHRRSPPAQHRLASPISNPSASASKRNPLRSPSVNKNYSSASMNARPPSPPPAKISPPPAANSPRANKIWPHSRTS